MIDSFVNAQPVKMLDTGLLVRLVLAYYFRDIENNADLDLKNFSF